MTTVLLSQVDNPKVLRSQFLRQWGKRWFLGGCGGGQKTLGARVMAVIAVNKLVNTKSPLNFPASRSPWSFRICVKQIALVKKWNQGSQGCQKFTADQSSELPGCKNDNHLYSFELLSIIDSLRPGNQQLSIIDNQIWTCRKPTTIVVPNWQPLDKSSSLESVQYKGKT